LYAAFHKVLPLRTDDLLIDRLLEAVEAGLRQLNGFSGAQAEWAVNARYLKARRQA
jgi:hypothetical protein